MAAVCSPHRFANDNWSTPKQSLTGAETVAMRNQWPSRAARQVTALSLVLVCLTGLSGAGADESAGTHFAHMLYLVRHGAYDTTARADPETGPGLTPLGIAQARLIASRLHGLPTRLDSITSSAPWTPSNLRAAV